MGGGAHSWCWYDGRKSEILEGWCCFRGTFCWCYSPGEAAVCQGGLYTRRNSAELCVRWVGVNSDGSAVFIYTRQRYEVAWRI
jgi:hypothetical protein